MNDSFSLCLTAAIVALLAIPKAEAMPSFARQTGESCSACHTQSFGPNLTPFGREFKLGGYSLRGGSGVGAGLPAVSAMIQGSFTHTEQDQPPPATKSGSAPAGFNNNNNFTHDQSAIFYAGRIADKIGAFSQLTYNGYTDRLALDNTDIRFADQFSPQGNQIIYGISANNSPSVQDLWNTTPVWSFPYFKSAVQPTIGATALIDGALSGQVGGVTAYAMINGALYLEAGGYASLANNIQKGIGVANAGQPQIDGGSPYWRLAFQQDWHGHYFSLGHYGFIADIFPGRDSSNGADHYTDIAFDATYQFMGNTRHIFETKATYIYEDQKLTADQLAGNVNTSGKTYLTTLKFNSAYTFDQTYGVTFGYNRTTGSTDPVLYQDYGSTRPNSEFYTVELVYVPFGKTDSYLHMLNLRTSLQYVGYSLFNGAGNHAGDNNTFMVNGVLVF